MGRMHEPHVDRFGRDVTQMRQGDLFMARGDFDGQSNPDLTLSLLRRRSGSAVRSKLTSL